MLDFYEYSYNMALGLHCSTCLLRTSDAVDLMAGGIFVQTQCYNKVLCVCIPVPAQACIHGHAVLSCLCVCMLSRPKL